MMARNFEVVVEKERLTHLKDSKIKVENLAPPDEIETGEILTLQHTKITVEQAK